MRMIEFEHAMRDPNPAGQLLLRRMARALALTGPLPAVPSLVQWRVSFEAGEGNEWREAPSIRKDDFLRRARPVSSEIQSALRKWAPYLWFSRAENWSDGPRMLPMVLYSVMPTYRAKSKLQYSHELLDREEFESALAVAERRLRSWAAGWFLQVRARGDEEAATRFQRARSGNPAAALLRTGSDFERMFGRERAIIELFIQTLERRENPLESEELQSTLAGLLERFFAGADFRALAPVILAAAESGLTGRAATYQLSVEPLTDREEERLKQEWPRAA